VDNNEEKVKLMKAGQSPILSRDLGSMQSAVNWAARVRWAQLWGNSVYCGNAPYPPVRVTLRRSRRRGIGAHLNGGYKVIVNKSTVPIGSGDWVRMIVLDGIVERQSWFPIGGNNDEALWRGVAGFDVVSNPEFLVKAQQFMTPLTQDRIVLGSNNPKAIRNDEGTVCPIVERKFAADPFFTTGADSRD